MQSELIRDGFVVIPQIVHKEFISELHSWCIDYIDRRPDLNNVSAPFPAGPEDILIRKLILWKPTLDALSDLGLKDIRYYSGVMLNSKPGDDVGGWHQDWWGWSYPESLRPEPPQIGIFYYLVDTARDNGCLRVIPGSQRKHIEWHDKELTDIATLTHPEEVNVPVSAGDVVIIDARLFHSRHANKTNRNRPLLSLWANPSFSRLSAPIRKRLGTCDPIYDEWLGSLAAPKFIGESESAIVDYVVKM